ncbi:uncharacterized protein YktA (UPF0223 family) [Gracilibacillus halotolerans]|uniref:UPF0223 protein GGQ92_000079 n=1 Tax=Gracilibacillus halotolerans TaxID=74386 RepID=A0A841RGZ2_9BACI|nr:UPF0223 family protein [Gracilibacillus halotolerans]MBB6511312.1 uncharacterized protein YktA (UPF0223 family) [Gracilibacillus halotolerans]
MKYSYPIDESWSTDEIVDIVNFLAQVEKAYEKGVYRQDLILSYQRFKEIVPSKSEEKLLDKAFEKNSGYSIYRVIKKAREIEGNEKIKMS